MNLERELIVNLQRHASDFGRSEALMLHGDRVGSSWKLAQSEKTNAVGLRVLFYTFADLLNQDTCIGHHGIVVIYHGSSQCGSRRRRIDEYGGACEQSTLAVASMYD